MKFNDVINDQRNYFKRISNSFNKEDIKYQTSRSNFKEKKLGFLTRAYYQRKNLLFLGNIVYCLTFKKHELNSNFPISTWVLFSPNSQIDKNPAILAKTLQKLEIFLNDKSNKKYHKLRVMLTENYSEPRYFLIPEEFSEGKIVYLSHCYFWREKIPDFKLGFNLIFMNQNVSKEIMYVVEKSWTSDYKKYYLR